jgi:hypothetical protein
MKQSVSKGKIVLATMNARYIHTSFGLRCLLANLGPLRAETCLLEFDIQQRPIDVAEVILAREPRIVGLGVNDPSGRHSQTRPARTGCDFRRARGEL